ncbi:MAG: hypothetical protein U0232_03520 [Thermomicrobiales bacterium]
MCSCGDLVIVPAAWGWTACGPSGLGLLRDEFTERTVKYWDLRDGTSAEFAPGIRCRWSRSAA